ncbi:MAG: AAA family ATPase [Firmicutes bacterium]|nr:AAA family ATPase [Bacillota bacterium]
MAIRQFLSKKAGRGQEEELLLWKAGQNFDKCAESREQDGITHLYSIPVGPLALSGRGKIIAVQSPAEGDGATTVAVNLAGLLALSHPERVVLADLAGYGTVRARMGLPTGECLINILDWEDIHSPGEINRGVFAHSSGVMVIPGVVHYDHVENIGPDLIFKMLTLLKESYDYIILDCPPVGTGNSVWAGIIVADAVLTVFKITGPGEP